MFLTILEQPDKLRQVQTLPQYPVFESGETVLGTKQCYFVTLVTLTRKNSYQVRYSLTTPPQQSKATPPLEEICWHTVHTVKVATPPYYHVPFHTHLPRPSHSNLAAEGAWSIKTRPSYSSSSPRYYPLNPKSHLHIGHPHLNSGHALIWLLRRSLLPRFILWWAGPCLLLMGDPMIPITIPATALSGAVVVQAPHCQVI